MGTKKIIISCFLFFFICLYGCVPRVAPPPIYRGADLTLDEVVQKSGRNIDALKAIADINVDRESRPYSYFSASALIKRPGQARMRIYKFGLPVNDILIKDENVFVLSGKNSGVVKELGREFYHAVFWWDGIKDGILHKEGTEYILRTESKEIYLDSETLFPLKQVIVSGGRSVRIIYSKPKNEEGFWYPSVINIKMGEYMLKVEVKKLILNPQLGEYDFNVPDQD